MGFSSGLMQGLLTANTALTQAQVHQRSASHLESRANILKSQIKSGYGDVEGNQAELDAVEEQQVKVQEMQMQSLNEASSTLGTALAPDTEKAQSETGADEKTASDTAKDEAADLRDRLKDHNIAALDYKDGMRIESDTKTNVAVSPALLERMAGDASLAGKSELDLAAMRQIDMTNQTDPGVSVRSTWSVDADGRISHHSVAATASDAAAFEGTRRQIEEAGREAFGSSFLGAYVHTEAPATGNLDSVGLLVSANV